MHWVTGIQMTKEYYQKKHLGHNSFGLKSHVKPGHTRSFSMNVALTVSMNIWRVQKKFLIPDTTDIE